VQNSLKRALKKFRILICIGLTWNSSQWQANAHLFANSVHDRLLIALRAFKETNFDKRHSWPLPQGLKVDLWL